MKPSIFCFFILITLFACDAEEPKPSGNNLGVLNIAPCLVPVSNATFDIITWNLKEFPLAGGNTINAIADIIKRQNADIIALQELDTTLDFEQLLNNLEGWEGALFDDGGLNLGFIYKKNEAAIIGELMPFYEDRSSPFPRAPLMVNARHTSGMELKLINIHLKCCGGEENEARRREASQLLKTYIDTNLPNEPVIILGDFNDLIVEENIEDNVFMDIIADSLNYRFADMEIALNRPEAWSYPSWPSHIDHILITNELFDKVASTETLLLDNCDIRYNTLVSDHRPLQISLSTP